MVPSTGIIHSSRNQDPTSISMSNMSVETGAPRAAEGLKSNDRLKQTKSLTSLPKIVQRNSQLTSSHAVSSRQRDLIPPITPLLG